jgi:hypothetical protein
MLRSSLAGRTSLFVSFPSTSYRATFTKSLRDDSSAHSPKPYIDAHGLLAGSVTDRLRYARHSRTAAGCLPDVVIILSETVH